MRGSRVVVRLDEATLKRLDRLVRRGIFSSRSQAIRRALADRLARLDGRSFARACALLDPEVEKAMAEEGLSLDVADWPEY